MLLSGCFLQRSGGIELSRRGVRGRGHWGLVGVWWNGGYPGYCIRWVMVCGWGLFVDLRAGVER